MFWLWLQSSFLAAERVPTGSIFRRSMREIEKAFLLDLPRRFLLMPKVNDKPSTREFLNEKLEFVRENCPNLVTVAATLVPFNDIFYREGVGQDPSTDEPFLWYHLRNHNLLPGVEMVAEVNDREVKVKQFCSDTGNLVAENYGHIVSFLEFLRTLPRPVDVFMRQRQVSP